MEEIGSWVEEKVLDGRNGFVMKNSESLSTELKELGANRFFQHGSGSEIATSSGTDAKPRSSIRGMTAVASQFRSSSQNLVGDLERTSRIIYAVSNQT